MRIAVIGGGPGGLYFSSLVKQVLPETEITVWERNAPDDTFGFGVVFSEQTLSGIKASDRSAFDEMSASFAYWDDIDIVVDGETATIGGNGFAAMSRKELLKVLQRRALAHGVDLRFRTEAPPVEDLMAGFDLVIACDGINSPTRESLAEEFGTSVDVRECKYMWLGTDKVYDAFKFFVRNTEWGTMQIHSYPMNDEGSTFIVEMHESTWRRAGLDKGEDEILAPGESDTESIARIEEIFREDLDGGRLLANNSKWLTFRTIRNKTLVYRNLALLGDSGHTAHYSIGSGTKLALEDALALAACVVEQPSVEAALMAYDKERGPIVKSTQRSAQASLEWFEDIDQYAGQELAQFAFNMMTRSRRITYGNLRERDPEFVDEVDQWLLGSEIARGRVPADTTPRPPMFLPFRLRDVELANRVVVSPIGLYSAVDGLPGDLHLVHYGARALGGAGLVLTEMVAVSPDSRITPGCPGIWNEAQAEAWRRIIEFVHTTPAKAGIQLGHAGRKGAVKPAWEGLDAPLDAGAWPLEAPTAEAFAAGSQVPREMTRADMDRVVSDFVSATDRAAAAGFDVLELHFGHGFLLSSFLTPVSNHRTDDYGGSTANRLRFPLEVLDAVRQRWPSDRPISVRFSASDWTHDGITEAESIELARAFVDHGADILDVSTGETTPRARPAYGRSYQTPFADRIRNQVGVPTISVGALSSWDDVNTNIAAGRSDLCAVGRPHLYDPNWTLHAAAEQGFRLEWPQQYVSGSGRPPAGRNEDPKPRLALVAPEKEAIARSSRWTPQRVPLS